MKTETYQHNILKKLIELPIDTAAGLALLASKRKPAMYTKTYMEKILIDHEKKMNAKERISTKIKKSGK